MKTLKISFVLLLSLFVFASCSKKEEAINPDAGAEIAGTYTITKVRYPDGTMGNVQAGYTKKVYLVRVSETEVDLSIENGVPGQTPEILHSNETAKLKRSGQTITLNSTAGDQVGTYTGGTLELKVLDVPSGQTGTFIGTR